MDLKFKVVVWIRLINLEVVSIQMVFKAMRQDGAIKVV